MPPFHPLLQTLPPPSPFISVSLPGPSPSHTPPHIPPTQLLAGVRHPLRLRIPFAGYLRPLAPPPLRLPSSSQHPTPNTTNLAGAPFPAQPPSRPPPRSRSLRRGVPPPCECGTAGGGEAVPPGQGPLGQARIQPGGGLLQKGGAERAGPVCGIGAQ
jgi:hypothetical protein